MSPVWNAVPVEKMEALSEKNAHMIIVGGTGWQIKAIKKLYPQAKALDIEADANVDASQQPARR